MDPLYIPPDFHPQGYPPDHPESGYNQKYELKDLLLMTPSMIELQIPPEIYERARQIAHESNRSIESVLLDGLTLLFGTLPAAGVSPDELKDYADEQLWAVVYQRLAWPQDTRLRELIALGKQGQITDEEKIEMERLIALVDHQMLLRSEALLLLKQRGHNVEEQLKLGA